MAKSSSIQASLQMSKQRLRMMEDDLLSHYSMTHYMIYFPIRYPPLLGGIVCKCIQNIGCETYGKTVYILCVGLYVYSLYIGSLQHTVLQDVCLRRMMICGPTWENENSIQENVATVWLTQAKAASAAQAPKDHASQCLWQSKFACLCVCVCAWPALCL